MHKSSRCRILYSGNNNFLKFHRIFNFHDTWVQTSVKKHCQAVVVMRWFSEALYFIHIALHPPLPSVALGGIDPRPSLLMMCLYPLSTRAYIFQIIESLRVTALNTLLREDARSGVEGIDPRHLALEAFALPFVLTSSDLWCTRLDFELHRRASSKIQSAPF